MSTKDKFMIKSMCGELKNEMTVNGMNEYISGVVLDSCVVAGAYSLPITKSVIYQSDDSCSQFSIKYFSDTSCSDEFFIKNDSAIAMDGLTCVDDSYEYSCGNVDDIDLNTFSGITQYGYQDETCSNLSYFMQYGCETDAQICISLQPFGAPDSARILCSDGNATTMSYAGYECADDPIASSRPVDTCVPFTYGLDDQFSQGNIYFTGTQKREITCMAGTSENTNNDNESNNSKLILAIILPIVGIIFILGIGLCIYKSKFSGADHTKNHQVNLSEVTNAPLANRA